MKIQFLKDHLDNKDGDKVDVSDDLANYLIRMGAAKEMKKEKVEKTKTKEKKEVNVTTKEKK